MIDSFLELTTAKYHLLLDRVNQQKGITVAYTTDAKNCCPFNHGVWFSYYIDDPDGHNIEIYWPTYVNAPANYQVQPINLESPKDALLAEVKRMAEQYGLLSR